MAILKDPIIHEITQYLLHTRLTDFQVCCISDILKNLHDEDIIILSKSINELPIHEVENRFKKLFELYKEYYMGRSTFLNTEKETKQELSMDSIEKNLVYPLREPPEDDIEQMALKTICSECNNYVEEEILDDWCKHPHDGKISGITGKSKTRLTVLNPSGYGCPNFLPNPNTKTGLEKYLPFYAALKEKRTQRNFIYTFSLFGVITFPYWCYQLLTLVF